MQERERALPSIASTAMILCLLLLLSDVFPGAFALPRVERLLDTQRSTGPSEASRKIVQSNLLRARSVEMDQTIASFEEQGLCFHYFAERPSWHPDPCIEYCKNHGGHGYDGVSTASIRDVLHLLPEPDLTKNDSVMLLHTPISTSNTVIRALSKPTTTAFDGSLLLANAQTRMSKKWPQASSKL